MYINNIEIREALFGLVGFYQTTNPSYPSLIPSLIQSRSGKRVNEVHGIIGDIENIDQSIKNFSNYIYPVYDNAVDLAGGYTKGSKIESGGVNYEYINDTPSTGTPPPDVTYWEEIKPLSDYLVKQVYAGIDEMMDTWINDKKVRTKVKSIYDSILLYSGLANYRDTVGNDNKFVGLRIRMKKGERSLVTVLNKIGSQFSGAFNGLDIYVYHSSQQQPLFSFQINSTNSKSSQWTNFPSDSILRYISDDYDAGGDFYIGYNQSQLEALGGIALRRDLTWQEAPCTCESVWYDYYQQYSQFIDVVGFEIAESEMPNGDLFDPDDLLISYTSNYGLNLNISTMCDIGYFIKQEEQLFADALNMTIGKRILSDVAYNTRGGNQIANQVKVEAKKELYSHEGAWGTVMDRYKASIKALSFDLSGLGEECFPCDDGAEIEMGTITLS